MANALRLALAVLALVSAARAHQSMSVPLSISRSPACRVGIGKNCPGPCPNSDYRLDVTKNNPAKRVRRGEIMVVRTLRNNHVGGFSRWSIVNVKDMYNGNLHRKRAFHYSCADTHIGKCSAANKKRDCIYDFNNSYFEHHVRIPKIYPDGVYVFSWVWYGGGRTWGDFGDYYDCTFIEISGGPRSGFHRPSFAAGNSPLSKEGKCTAAVNRIGVCKREPCEGGGRFTKLYKPYEFERSVPPAILGSAFRNRYQRPKASVKVLSLTIRKAKNPSFIFATTLRTRSAHIRLFRGDKPTVTCETEGKVKSVTFYVHGRLGRVDYTWPYSIGGDWIWWADKKPRYSHWKFEMENRVTTISCRALGRDGTESWENLELSTVF